MFNPKFGSWFPEKQGRASSPTVSRRSPIIDTTNNVWKKEWTLDSSLTFGDIAGNLYVEGTGLGGGKPITLHLVFQKLTGEYLCCDELKVTVVSPELDIGETARPANRIGYNDPRTVNSARNKIVVWSTDSSADKTEYNLLKHSDIPGVYYKIEQRQNWNSGYPITDILTVDSLTINPIHDHDDTSWDYKTWYGPSASQRDKVGPSEIYAISEKDYNDARFLFNSAIFLFSNWADAVYKRFKEGHWRTSGSESNWHPTSIGTVSFLAEQPEGNVPYADLTHKFGASFSIQPDITINGRRYPQTLATVPVYYWDYITGTNVGNLFIGDERVESVIKAFLEQIPYNELNDRYIPTGGVQVINWEFSMADHHKLYWTSDETKSLTGGNDTLLKLTGDSLALGDVWVVGSDPANKLYGGGGHIELKVEKLANGDLKIHTNPTVNMTVEDMFDFNYWNDGLGPHAAASIQCAYGHKGTGVGQVALLRFDVMKDVENIGDIIINKP